MSALSGSSGVAKKRSARSAETLNLAHLRGAHDDFGFMAFDRLTVAPLEGGSMVLETGNLVNTGAPL